MPAPVYPVTPAGIYPNPPNLPWWVVLILGFITYGLFGWIWAFVEAAWVRKVDQRSKGVGFLALAVSFVIVGLIVTVAMAQNNGPPVGLPVILAGDVMVFVAAFNMRRSIETHYNSAEPVGLKLSGAMTFFFSFLYFQYHFSRIVKMKKAGIAVAAGT